MTGSPNAVLAELHSEMKAEFNRAAGTEGWHMVDLPRMSPQFFDDLLTRFGIGQAKMVAGSSGNFRVVNGKSERAEKWVRATFLVSPLGMQNLRDSRASGIEGEAGDPQGLHPEGESPVPEGQTPTPSSGDTWDIAHDAEEAAREHGLIPSTHPGERP
jgi:hypothetical protein